MCLSISTQFGKLQVGVSSAGRFTTLYWASALLRRTQRRSTPGTWLTFSDSGVKSLGKCELPNCSYCFVVFPLRLSFLSRNRPTRRRVSFSSCRAGGPFHVSNQYSLS